MYPTRYTDPQAVGRLVAEYVSCGKPNCRCQRGHRHGPYWYLHYREWDGRRFEWRQRKKYVPRPRLDEVLVRTSRTRRGDRAMMTLLRRGRRLRGGVHELLRGRLGVEQFEALCRELVLSI